MSRLTERASAPVALWVPGRIEVLGKHTDYGGGRSLLCAVERGIAMLAQPAPDGTPRVRIRDANLGDTAAFDLAAETPPTPGHWTNYPITVARRIALNFGGPLRGADIVFASDIPHAAGVSSSSALVVAVFLALSAINDLPDRSEYRDNIATAHALAGYLGAVENGLDFGSLRGREGVGTFGGSEDHTAILCARPQSLVQFSFRPVVFERQIAVPPGLTFVVAASGVQAEKTGAALARYNDVSRRLTAALEQWNRATGRTDPSMGAALSSSPDARARIAAVLEGAHAAPYPAQALVERFEQFAAETADIIPSAADALARADVASFGRLVAESQAGAERALHNQIPETIGLVRGARELGALAASAFGAGFGGSVWALVESGAATDFARRWANGYGAAFPEPARRATFFVTRAAAAARAL